jgi:hypothetical protein
MGHSVVGREKSYLKPVEQENETYAETGLIGIYRYVFGRLRRYSKRGGILRPSHDVQER